MRLHRYYEDLMMPSQGYLFYDVLRILYGYGWEEHPIAIGGKGIPFAIWWKGTLLASVGTPLPFGGQGIPLAYEFLGIL